MYIQVFSKNDLLDPGSKTAPYPWFTFKFSIKAICCVCRQKAYGVKYEYNMVYYRDIEKLGVLWYVVPEEHIQCKALFKLTPQVYISAHECTRFL